MRSCNRRSTTISARPVVRCTTASSRSRSRRSTGHVPAAVLATHWAATGRDHRDRVAEWARRAGDEATTALSPEEAIRWYTTALDAIDRERTRRRRVDVLIALGDAQRWADTDAFRQTLLDAAALAERMGDDDALVRAALSEQPRRREPCRRGRHRARRRCSSARSTSSGPTTAPSGPACSRRSRSSSRRAPNGSVASRSPTRPSRAPVDSATRSPCCECCSTRPRRPDSRPTLDQRIIDTEEMFDIAKRLGDPVLLGIAALREVRVMIEARRLRPGRRGDVGARGRRAPRPVRPLEPT